MLTEKNGVGYIVDILRSDRKERSKEIARSVSKILSLVRREGDEALIKLSKRYDGSDFKSPSDLFAKREEFDRAYLQLDLQSIRSLRKSYQQTAWLAKNQMKRFSPVKLLSPLGFKIEEKYSPLNRIGGYIPGGLASYASTVAMICAPARAAGVNEIVLATPAPGGRVNDAVLVAADICGVSKVIKTGGAQAIAALAFGTESVRPVELISGPGNEYVTEAKKQALEEGISIDLLAGPTELLVVADSTADPVLVFEELVSQAEHGNRTLCGVVSDSTRLIQSVLKMAKNPRTLERLASISQSVMFTVKASSFQEALEFARAFAPEHLEIMASKSVKYEVMQSGLVLSGNFTPCSATDYIVGTNHIIPTGGTASKSEGVSVETFLRRRTLVRGSKDSLKRSLSYICEMANLEGLSNHARAAKARFAEVQRS